MGVWLDRGLKMTTHIRRLTERAEVITNNLIRITLRLVGPSDGKKRVLAATVVSTILYVTPIWMNGLTYGLYERLLERANRKLAISTGYRCIPYGSN
ncbi:hypothetical protein GWI33_001705 [Rhynchophorus ferrugineus]|uniref:Uncharacterized protein n=1 Tax=Rhynchophorus ferrugineus TaxID=354439 RepID=A0A834IW12_RHYFE|nr:hypothetical protein GWI33_001705 [Rhynchophorus ferrugineus]